MKAMTHTDKSALPQKHTLPLEEIISLLTDQLSASARTGFHPLTHKQQHGSLNKHRC